MIRFALACPQDHRFEAWFRSSAAYDEQREDGVVVCPICGDNDVSKALMTPAVTTERERRPVALPEAPIRDPQFLEMLRKVRQHLTSEADYVGNRFAEEARRIHFDEAEKRGIYGEASGEDVRSLLEDGIEVHPLPVLPEDHN